MRHERFEVETDYVRDPVTYELDSVPRVDWKLVPYGELLNSASERHPVRQTIEPADWYYNGDEKDEEHPNLVVVSDRLSVAGLATILRMNRCIGCITKDRMAAAVESIAGAMVS